MARTKTSATVFRLPTKMRDAFSAQCKKEFRTQADTFRMLIEKYLETRGVDWKDDTNPSDSNGKPVDGGTDDELADV